MVFSMATCLVTSAQRIPLASLPASRKMRNFHEGLHTWGESGAADHNNPRAKTLTMCACKICCMETAPRRRGAAQQPLAVLLRAATVAAGISRPRCPGRKLARMQGEQSGKVQCSCRRWDGLPERRTAAAILE